MKRLFLFTQRIKLRYSWFFFLKKNKFKKDEWYFVLNEAIGDTYMVCSFLPYLISRGDKVNVISYNKNQSFIPRLFSNEIKVIDVQIPIDLVKMFGKYQKGVPLIVHPYYISNSLLLKLIGYKKIHAYDIFKFLFDISPFALPHRPLFINSHYEEIEHLFKGKNLTKGNTVLICPDANSISELSNEFWSIIIEKLINCNYDIVIMSRKYPASQVQTINFPLHYAKQLCDYAGFVVSLRSGFCDLIATSNARKVILYPDMEWYSGNLLDGASLKNHGLNDTNLLELKVNIATDILAKEIAGFFNIYNEPVKG